MTVAMKSALLLAVTLALGLVVGFAGAGSLDRMRRERLGALGRPMGFAGHMEEVISPRDPAQGDQVRPIIARAAERNQRIIREANASLRGSVDSMKAELLPLLDDTQRRRLEDATRGLPPFGIPGGRGGRGGPPGGPPGGPGRGGRGGPDGPPPFGPPPDRPPPE